ncbi:unnamed protein product, partial [Closterium sp. NIES-53]
MDVWGPARVSGQGRERYFLLDLPVLRLHSDRGGEFSSDLLREFCRGEGILQSFTLPASPQQNGIAERRIGLVMEYAAHQLNLWPLLPPHLAPCPPLVGCHVCQVGSHCLFPYRSAPLPHPPLFLAPGPPSVDPLPPQGPAPSGVSHVDPLPGTVPVEVAVDSGAARGAASGGAASGGAEPASAEPGGVEPACTEPGVAESEGAEPGGAEPERAELGGAELGGAEPKCAEPGGTEPGGTLSPGGPPGALSRREPLSPPQLHKWFARRTCLWSGAAGAEGSAAGGTGAPSPGGTGAAGARGAAGVGAGGTGAGAAEGTGAAGPGGARTGGTGAAGAGGAAGVGAGGTGAGAAGGTGVGAAGGTGAAGPRGAHTGGIGGIGGTGAAGAGGAAGVGAGDYGAGNNGVGGAGPGGAGAVGAGSGDTRRPRPYFVPMLQQVLGLLSSTDLVIPLLCPPPDQSQPPLQLASPLPAPSPYTEQIGGLTERCEPVSHPASPVRAVRTCRRVPHQRPPPVPGTHHMALRPSSVPQRVPMPSPPASSLADDPDPETDLVCATSPTVPRLLATVITDPLFESAAASALVAELVDFAATCHLDYAASLEDFECFAAAVPHLVSMLIAPEGDPDAPDIPTPRSYAEAITGFSQRQGVEFFHTFSPTSKMTTLWVLLHVAAQRDYELHFLDFSTPFLQGSLHEEIWLRRPPGFTGSFPAGTLWNLRRPVYGLRQAPHEWHDTLRTTLAALGFAPSTADPSLFLRTDTSLPPFYVLMYVDDLVFATADTEALNLVKLELQKRHTCTDL